MGAAAERWAEQLAAWAIPEHILAAAPESPWRFPPALFALRADDGADTPSRARAREAVPPAGTVLDVGCGGGAAGLPLAPPAACVVGFDQSDELLAAFASAAAERGIDHRVVHGRWPDDHAVAPVADVVVCHHVAYNVPDLAGFAAALSTHARRRVVLELTGEHPRAHLNWLWPRFWGIDRPTGPTADDAVAVLVEAGIRPSADRAPRRPRNVPSEEQVASVRRYLCLPADRDPELAALLGEHVDTPLGQVVTLWWDGTAPAGG